MPTRATWQLRAAFAQRMALTYGREVPAYNTLVEVSAAVNADVLARDGDSAQRLGSIQRVTAERHGAIRVGTPSELHAVARVFAALGMYPVGFYDLRDAARSAVPVVSTAFRPLAAAELARNPFRMFTSMLVTDDRRFFSPELQQRLDGFLARRTLFRPELLVLAEIAIAGGGLDDEDAERFLKLATAAFELCDEPVDRAWYAELEAVSAVAADIGGVSSTHINHLTPRVLDIDELYRRMTERGVTMIDEIQGPPRWEGPDVLLRQTSFRALAEQRRFRDPDGSVSEGALRVRFGEVEARGIALTPAGRDRYDAMLAEVDRRLAAGPGSTAPGTAGPDSAGPDSAGPDSAGPDSAGPDSAGPHGPGAEGPGSHGPGPGGTGRRQAGRRQVVAAEVWRERLPATELGLLRDGLGFFTFAPDSVHTGTRGDHLGTESTPESTLEYTPEGAARLVEAGVLTATPIVYEDFLPRSAAGIFQSNLTSAGRKDSAAAGSTRDAGWLSDVIGTELADPAECYAAQQQESWERAVAALS